MKTQSTEPERLQEQTTANRRRIAAYRARQSRFIVESLDAGEVPINSIPEPWWFKRQAD